MFNIFKNNNIGDKFRLNSENYLDVICTIIGVDENILSINLYDNYNNEEILNHIPIYKKDFNNSKITYIGKEDSIENYSLEGYNNWKIEKGGVFSKKMEAIIDSFPSNKIIYLKKNNTNIRDYSIIKQKGINTKAIFSNDGRNIIGFYPLDKRVLLPKITFQGGDLIINEHNFIKLGIITVDKNEIAIGYYNYSLALGGSFDLEMFNFSYKNISDNLYNILKVIKILDKHMLSFEIGGYVSVDDFEIEYDTNSGNYIFRWFKNEYKLEKNITELLIKKYIILMNKFIKEKNIIIELNKKNIT